MSSDRSAAGARIGTLLGRWWWQGLRSLALQAPDWRGLDLAPGVLALLALAPTALLVGVQWLLVSGQPGFLSHGLLHGGSVALLPMLLAAWAALRPSSGGPGAIGAAPPEQATARLFALMCAQLPWLVMLAALVPLMAMPAPAAGTTETADEAFTSLPRTAGWVAWWGLVAQVKLLAGHVAERTPRLWGPVFACLIAAQVLQAVFPPVFWYGHRPRPAVAAQAPGFQLSQAVFEAQQAALQRDLAALAKPTDERGELFVVTFAPNADEDVFERESRMVADVMDRRFGTRPRTLLLMNRKQDVPAHGWATPENLRRSLAHIGRLMDPERDLLFIHLTSHGARDGALAPSFDPLAIEALQPRQLKAWLDEAGIRFRIVSVSACYAGSWIAPLAGPESLVLTAADSDHTSYGCGRKSTLTYFGRAMYDEALRAGGSFEAAHASSRGVIERREREAGKDDGYSNPQIAMGAALRPRLAELESRSRP